MNRWIVIGGVGLVAFLLFTDTGRRFIGMPVTPLPPSNPVPPQPVATGAPMGGNSGCPSQLNGAQCLARLNEQEATKREMGWQNVAGNAAKGLLSGLGLG